MYDDEEKYEPEIYYIPANIDNNGSLLGGLLKLKNIVETVVIDIILILMWKILTYPFSFTVKMVTFVLFILPITILCIIGINDESFLEWFFEVTIFKKKKRDMKYRLPVKLEEPEKKGKLNKLFQKEKETE